MALVYEDILQICKDENDLRDFLIDNGDFSGVCPHCSKGDLRLDADKSFSIDGFCGTHYFTERNGICRRIILRNGTEHC